MDGIVDEFMLWNRTLTDDEIEALYYLQSSYRTQANTMGAIYYNSKTDYICVNNTETSEEETIIERGNGTESGTIDQDILIWWHAEEDAQDSLWSITATNQGGNNATGQIGYGYNFDRAGTDWFQFADSAHYDTMDVNEAYSWCIWVKADSWNTGVANDCLLDTEPGAYPFKVRRNQVRS